MWPDAERVCDARRGIRIHTRNFHVHTAASLFSARLKVNHGGMESNVLIMAALATPSTRANDFDRGWARISADGAVPLSIRVYQRNPRLIRLAVLLYGFNPSAFATTVSTTGLPFTCLRLRPKPSSQPQTAHPMRLAAKTSPKSRNQFARCSGLL